MARRSPLHGFRRRYSEQAQPVCQYLARGIDQNQTCITQGGVLDDEIVCVVIGMEVVCQFTQVIGELVRLMIECGAFQYFGVTRQTDQQPILV